jgi:hypothetical protein
VIGSPRSAPWKIQYFQRHADDDANEACPTKEFLDSLPNEVVAELRAILEAVAEAPPPSFSGGGKWEVMNGAMAGFHEVRVSRKGTNYRLFCILVRDPTEFEGPAIVCIGGLSKPLRSAARDRDYRLIRDYKEEYDRRLRVLGR